jgi:hypothetical protein
LLDVLRKRIDHRAFVITLVCPEEPAVNERVDLGAVKFDHKAAKARQTSCPETPHSLRYTVGRLPNHTSVLSDDYCTPLYQIALVAARFMAMVTSG